MNYNNKDEMRICNIWGRVPSSIVDKSTGLDLSMRLFRRSAGGETSSLVLSTGGETTGDSPSELIAARSRKGTIGEIPYKNQELNKRYISEREWGRGDARATIAYDENGKVPVPGIDESCILDEEESSTGFPSPF